MGSIPITVSDVVRETTLNFTVDILSYLSGSVVLFSKFWINPRRRAE